MGIFMRQVYNCLALLIAHGAVFFSITASPSVAAPNCAAAATKELDGVAIISTEHVDAGALSSWMTPHWIQRHYRLSAE